MDPKKLLSTILGMREEEKEVRALADKARANYEREIYMPLFAKCTEGTLSYSSGIETIAAFSEIKELITDKTRNLGPEGSRVLLAALAAFVPQFAADLESLCEKFNIEDH